MHLNRKLWISKNFKQTKIAAYTSIQNYPVNLSFTRINFELKLNLSFDHLVKMLNFKKTFNKFGLDNFKL